MDAMTSRERLKASLAGEPVDRVAWSPCVDGYFLSSLPEDRQLDELGVHREIGADALLRHVMVYTTTAPTVGALSKPADNPRVDIHWDLDDDGTTRRQYETKVGTHMEEFRFNPE